MVDTISALYHASEHQHRTLTLDLQTLEVVRFGSCFELIRDILNRHFNVALPDPPAINAGEITDEGYIKSARGFGKPVG